LVLGVGCRSFLAVTAWEAGVYLTVKGTTHGLTDALGDMSVTTNDWKFIDQIATYV